MEKATNLPDENLKVDASSFTSQISSNLKESKGAIPKQTRTYAYQVNGQQNRKETFIGKKIKEIENDLEAVHNQMNGFVKQENLSSSKPLFYHEEKSENKKLINGLAQNKTDENKKDLENDNKKLEEMTPPIKPERHKNKIDISETNTYGTLKLGKSLLINLINAFQPMKFNDFVISGRLSRKLGRKGIGKKNDRTGPERVKLVSKMGLS